MSDWVLKYADARGEIHQQVAQAVSEQEVRDRFAQQGYLIYSIRPRRTARGLSTEVSLLGRRKKLNLEKFLIFNQQFVTLIRAGLPILKGLDLLADRHHSQPQHRTGGYDMTRFTANTRTAVAALRYLMETEPPIPSGTSSYAINLKDALQPSCQSNHLALCASNNPGPI